jgi:glycosyltransferase involved in cell wall biosynthesis
MATVCRYDGSAPSPASVWNTGFSKNVAAGFALNVAWLTMNPNLGASARSLQDWAVIAPTNGLSLSVVLRSRGGLSEWLQQLEIPHTINPMPWPGGVRTVSVGVNAVALRRWIRQQHARVLHCYEHDLYPFAVILRALTGLPLVCHVHFAMERPFAAWAFSGWRLPEAVIWTSEQQRRDCESAVTGIVPAERQHVVPLGLSVERFGKIDQQGSDLRRQLGIGSDQVVVATACALRARKRVDDFLSLAEVILQRHPYVTVLLAGGEVPGDEQYASEIVPRIRAAERHPRFRWLGHLEPVEPLMHAADVFVSTSEYETFGMSVLEAMACGKAVVAYEAGSVLEVLGAAGVTVKTGDIAELIAGTEALLSNVEVRARYGAAARVRVATTFDPADSFSRITSIYDGLLQQRVGRQ